MELRLNREATSGERKPFYAAIDTLTRMTDLSEEYYATIASIFRPLISRKSAALDIGCALGRLTFELARCGAKQAVGVDISPRLPHEARRLASREGVTHLSRNALSARPAPILPIESESARACDFLVADALLLPFEANSFDFCLGINLLNVVREPKRAVCEITRVLIPGGYALIANPYDWTPQLTDRQHWVTDLRHFADAQLLKPRAEWDEIPFVLRGTRGVVAIYMTHCVLFQKL